MESPNNNEVVSEEEKKKTAIPKWLKNIQENSWELELLISGGAIFSLFKLSDPYVEWVIKFGTMTGFAGLGILAVIGYFSMIVLTLGFCVHLCFRAYWLALVCVNYAYPKGINTQKMNFKKPFKTTILEENTLKDTIIKIDKYAGLIMFASVLSVFILIGIVFLLGLLLFLLNLAQNSSLNSTLLGIIHIIATLLFSFIPIYILDLLLFNGLRKIKYFSYVVFPFFFLFDIVSLRLFYQSAFFLFVTNVNKKRFLLICIPFLIASFVITYLSIQDEMNWPNVFDQREYRFQQANNYTVHHNYYKDEQLSEKYYRFSISSKVQKEKYMEVYIAYTKHYDWLVERLPLADSLKSMEQIIEIKIDSTKLENVSWFPTYAKNGYSGITSILPTQQFKNGEHTLFVTIGKNIDKDEMTEFVIPFWIYR